MSKKTLLLLAASASLMGCFQQDHSQSLHPVVDVSGYENAEKSLPGNLRSLVLNEYIQVNWIEGKSSEFWYRRETVDGYEWIIANADVRQKTALFDHEILAEQLRAHTDDAIDHKDLPISNLTMTDEENVVEFYAFEKTWRYGLVNSDLTEVIEPNEPVGTKSPDGKWFAQFKDNNLFIVNSDESIIRQITTEGSDVLRCGRRLPNPRGLLANPGVEEKTQSADVYWSEDSTRLASYCIDTEGSTQLTLTRALPLDGSLRADSVNYVYPLTNDEQVPLANGFVFNVEDETRTDFDLAPQPILYYYGPYYQWRKDDRSLLTVIPDRGYEALRGYSIDSETGASKEFLTETGADGVDYYGHWWNYDKDTDQLQWMSDRTGWSHFYLVDISTGETRQVTDGDWRFRYIAGSSNDEDATYFVVGAGREEGRDPYFRTVYRQSAENEEITLLTPEPLDHDAVFSEDGRYFVDNMSSMNIATRTVLRDGNTGDILMELEAADLSAFDAEGFSLPEPFVTKAADNETDIYGAIFKPSNFDSSLKYPVIDNIYTGPHYVMTPKSLSAALGRTALSVAQPGFIVVTVDGRGTNKRSRAFLDPAFGELNIVGLDDHEAAIRWLASQNEWIDIDRVGVYGFSAGGYDTARALFRRPKFYKAGVSASGNHDHTSDKAIWNENWLGYPISEEDIQRNSNLTYADQLEGSLLLAHGELDENVPPMATLQLADRLMKANKDFEMLIVPGEDHFLDDHDYFNRRRLDFFVQTLLEQEPPKYEFGADTEE